MSANVGLQNFSFSGKTSPKKTGIIIIIVATYIAQHSVRKDAHGAERKKLEIGRQMIIDIMYIDNQ